MVTSKKTRKRAAVSLLVHIAETLLEQACSCDIMYGVQCNIHSYKSEIDKLKEILLSED